MTILPLTGNTKALNIANDDPSSQKELAIDPTPVFYIAKYNRVIDTSLVLKENEEKDVVLVDDTTTSYNGKNR